jgi:hypothetical protein
MLDTNHAEVFGKGSIAWASYNAVKFLETWHSTVGWSKDTAIPSHVITFSPKEDEGFSPNKPFFLDFKGGSLSEDITQEDFVSKDNWRDIIKSLIRKDDAVGYVFIAESSNGQENKLIVSYEGIGGIKLVNLIGFDLVDEELVFNKIKSYSLENSNILIESDLTNIFNDMDVLN